MSHQQMDWSQLSSALPPIGTRACDDDDDGLAAQHVLTTFLRTSVVTCPEMGTTSHSDHRRHNHVLVGEEYLLGAVYVHPPFGLPTPAPEGLSASLSDKSSSIAKYRRKRRTRGRAPAHTYECRQRFARARPRLRGRFI